MLHIHAVTAATIRTALTSLHHLPYCCPHHDPAVHLVPTCARDRCLWCQPAACLHAIRLTTVQALHRAPLQIVDGPWRLHRMQRRSSGSVC